MDITNVQSIRKQIFKVCTTHTVFGMTQQTLQKAGTYYQDACRCQRAESNSWSIQRDKKKSKKDRQ